MMSTIVRDKVLESKAKKPKLAEEEKESQTSSIMTNFLLAEKQKAMQNKQK